MHTGQNQQLLSPLKTKTKTKAETEERKQWLECINQWQLKKDVQCIRIHGYDGIMTSILILALKID